MSSESEEKLSLDRNSAEFSGVAAIFIVLNCLMGAAVESDSISGNIHSFSNLGKCTTEEAKEESTWG